MTPHQSSNTSNPRPVSKLLEIFYSGTRNFIADQCFDGITDLADIVTAYFLPKEMFRVKLLPPFSVALHIIDIFRFTKQEIALLLEAIYSPKVYKIMFPQGSPSFALVPDRLREMVGKKQVPLGSSLAYANLQDMKLEDMEFRGNLQHIKLSRSKLNRLTFSVADMQFIDLADATTRDLYFCNADMYGANLTNSKLYCARFYQVNLTEAVMVNTNCTYANFAGGANMTRANTSRMIVKNTIYERYSELICCQQLNPTTLFVNLLKHGLELSETTKNMPDVHLRVMSKFLADESNYVDKDCLTAMAKFLTMIKNSPIKLDPYGLLHQLCEISLSVIGSADARGFICDNAGLSRQIWIQDYGMSCSFQTLFDFEESKRLDGLGQFPASVIFANPKLPAPSSAVQKVMRSSSVSEENDLEL